MGFFAGKKLGASRDTVAQILFFLITPVVIFNGVINTKLDPSVLSLPLLTFLIGSILCLLFYKLSKKIWHDSTRNLLAISAGTGNTGYFGLPIALLLFDAQGEGVYIMSLLGVSLFENSLGFYMLAKGTHTAKESVQKLIKLPALYAFLFGVVVNLANFHPPVVWEEFAGYIKGTYTVLGMMIIGLSLAHVTHFKLDYKYIGMSFAAKFLAWPVIVLLLIFIDTHWLHYYDQTIYDALLLLSTVPLAANTVVLASLLKNQPEKAATAVILSTLFAIVYIPCMAIYFL